MSKIFPKIITVFFLFFLCCAIVSAQNKEGNFLSAQDTAAVPHEIEDPENIGINKEAAHATLMPYGNLNEALLARRHSSSFSKSLNGMWKFNWVDWPQKRPVNFYKTNYDVSAWKEIKVPSNFQVEGYGTPYYSNFNYEYKAFHQNIPRQDPGAHPPHDDPNKEVQPPYQRYDH